MRHPQATLAEQLQSLSQYAQHQSADYYGTGGVVADFEQQCVQRFGKAAALLVPSGSLAQPMALRIYSDARRTRKVALHPTSHLLLHEENGIEALWQLEPVVFGTPTQVPSLEEIQRAIAVAGGTSEVAALIYELPMREIGGQLPAWDELVEVAQWLRGNGIALHLDGARLWQCPAYYDKSLAEIAALADSVYVSLYKDLGGIAGAVLLGSEDFIAEARVWTRRAGGNLPTMYPFALAAQHGLTINQDAIAAALPYTQALGKELALLPGVEINPHPPQVAMFHLTLQHDVETILRAVIAYTQASGVLLLPKPWASEAGATTFELSIGRNALAQPVNFWVTHFREFLQELD